MFSSTPFQSFTWFVDPAPASGGQWTSLILKKIEFENEDCTLSPAGGGSTSI
jgi:hypothetical protein